MQKNQHGLQKFLQASAKVLIVPALTSGEVFSERARAANLCVFTCPYKLFLKASVTRRPAAALACLRLCRKTRAGPLYLPVSEV